MDKTIESFVGRQAKTARLEQGLRLEDVADALEMSVSQIQKYEAGSARMSTETLWRLAEYLQKPVSYFFDDKGAPANHVRNGEDALRTSLLRAYDKISKPEYREMLVGIAKQFSRR